MATIYDVAKLANVSPSTVSRIINGERNVAPATAAVVEEALKKAGYVRKAVRPGRKPSKRQGVQTGIIDFLSLGSHSPAEMFSLTAFSSLLEGIMREVESHGMDLVFSHSPHGKIIPPVLARRRADGVLVFGNPSLYSQIKKAIGGVPVVWCFRTEHESNLETSHVLYDNAPVGRLAAEYLLERGCRRIAFMNASLGNAAFAERRDVFCSTIHAKGLHAVVLKGNAVEPPYDSMAIRAQPLVDQLMLLDQLPEGIFCETDDLMLAVYHQLQKRGIKPGEDIMLIGCNKDSQCMDQMHPRPATIDLKLGQVGQQATARLIWEISNPDARDISQSRIQPVLVPEGSNPET